MRKNDTIYIDHIKNSLIKIKKYLQDKTREDFLDNDQTQDAVIRQLEIIGEASKQLSKEFRDNHPDIPWTDMAGMRNKLIHNYIDVDLDIVWNTAHDDVPILLGKINKLNYLY